VDGHSRSGKIASVDLTPCFHEHELITIMTHAVYSVNTDLDPGPISSDRGEDSRIKTNCPGRKETHNEKGKVPKIKQKTTKESSESQNRRGARLGFYWRTAMHEGQPSRPGHR
jgi:hypothetical protein